MSGPGAERYAALSARLLALEQAGLRRELKPLHMLDATRGELHGRPIDVFCSNDYLGLSHHPDVVAAWSGTGTGSARLISGDRLAHHALEEELGELFGRPATLMSSGWHANLALVTTLLGRGDRVVSDALNHASIIDAIRLSGAGKHITEHGAVDVPSGSRLAIVEGLYSMRGSTPALGALREACEAVGAWLAVDEAHAFGVLGPQGRGEAAAQGVEPDFLVGTLGKALGCFGAFVIGPPQLRELLLSVGRSFIFTTGLAEPAANAALVALRHATDERRAALAANVRRLRTGLGQLGIDALGEHHVVPIVLGARTMAISRKMLDAGIYAPGIRPPTVPVGSERIRVTLSAAHSVEQIDRLLDTLDRSR